MEKCKWFKYDIDTNQTIYCENQAVEKSCNHGSVCEEHFCRCSEYRKHSVRYAIDSTDPVMVSDEPTKVKNEITPSELEILMDGTNGVRIISNGSYNTTVECKDANGKWVMIGGISKVICEVSIDSPVPKVTIERYIIK